MAGATLANQAHCALADFGGELYGFLHGSIFSRVGASTKSGAVQFNGPAAVWSSGHALIKIKRIRVEVYCVFVL